MVFRTPMLALALAACQPAAPSLPWLHGLSDVKTSTTGATDLDGEELPARCGIGATKTLELQADLAPTAGRERIVASFARGVLVLGQERQLVAEAPGFACSGSADELEVLAVGRAYGVPTLVIAATEGGHNEAATWLGLLRPGLGSSLDATFTQVVEQRVGDEVHRGDVWLLPGGLLYQRPNGPVTFWIFDDAARAYIPFGPIERTEPPHAPTVSALPTT